MPYNFTKPFFIVIFLFLIGLPIYPQSTQEIPGLGKLKLKTLNFDIPSPIQKNLDYNSTLFELEDSESPLMTLKFYFANGLQNESIERAGYLNALTHLIEMAGPRGMEGPKFSEALIELEMTLGIEMGEKVWVLEAKFPKKNLDKALALLQKLILEPALPQSYLKDIKNEMLVEIEQRNERVESIASRYLNALLFPGQRKGYSLTKKDVENLNLNEIKREHAWRINPQDMYITFTGPIKNVHLSVKLKPLLQAWKSKSIFDPFRAKDIFEGMTLSKINEKYRGKIILVNKNFPQAVVRVGSYLPPHNDSRFYSLQVGNMILGGGGFTSRLMQKIRNQEGLAYYAYSANHFEAEYGIFTSGCGTRSDQLDRALEMLLKEIENITKGVTPMELELARDSILNAYIFQFESSEKIVSETLRFRLHKMPSDYMQLFPKAIARVTSNEISKSSSYWQNPYVIVVGSKDLEKKLSRLKPVIVKELDEPLF